MKKILFFCCLLALTVWAAASCAKSGFSLTFTVDGEVYATRYTEGNETVKLPKEPHKDGYTFDGWVWMTDSGEKPFTATALLHSALAESKEVYAKFTHDSCTFTNPKVTPPTCAEQGYTTQTCACGKTRVSDYTNRIDHIYGDWHTRLVATAYTDGTRDRVCSLCGHTDTAIIPRKAVTVSQSPGQYPIYSFDLPLFSSDPNQILNIKPVDVVVDTEQKIYTVKADDMPSPDAVHSMVKETLSANGLPVSDLDDYTVELFVKNEQGAYVPVPLS